MEGDVITLQDIFLYDHSMGFDAERPQPRQPQGHRAAPEVPREARAQQRPRRPDALRPGRWLIRMRTSARSPPRRGGGPPASVGAAAVARPGRSWPRPRARGHGARSTTSSRQGDAPGRRLPRRTCPTASTPGPRHASPRRSTASPSSPTAQPLSDAGAGASSAPPSSRWTSATAWRAPSSTRPRTRPTPSSTTSPPTSTSGWSPSPATSTVAQEPTQDLDAVRAVDRRARAQPRDTSLYDGLIEAVEASRHRGRRAACSCSPTAPTPTEHRRSQTAARPSRSAEVKVDVVALAQSEADKALLEQLADAGQRAGAQRRRPRRAARAVFADEAETLAQQVLVTVTPTAETGRQRGHPGGDPAGRRRARHRRGLRRASRRPPRPRRRRRGGRQAADPGRAGSPDPAGARCTAASARPPSRVLLIIVARRRRRRRAPEAGRGRPQHRGLHPQGRPQARRGQPRAAEPGA